MLRVRSLVLCALAAAAVAARAQPAAPVVLENAFVRAQFGPRGLVAVADRTRQDAIRLTHDEFALTIDGRTIESGALAAPLRTAAENGVTYTWTSDPYRIEVRYEMRPDWHFVSKQLAITGRAGGDTMRVDEVRVIDAATDEAIESQYVPRAPRRDLGTNAYGTFLRLADRRGLLALVQNPFLDVRQDGRGFAIGYRPEMDWPRREGPFLSDRGLLVPYVRTGRRLAAEMIPEWAPAPDEPQPPGMDEAEIAAFTDAVRSFLLYKPTKPLNVLVGWCSNDYQIDVALGEGRDEYQRLIDRAAQLGARYVLYAPSNSALAHREDSVDDWSWEHVLWLGLGQRIRKGEWNPRTDAVPATVQSMVEYAAGKDVKLLAYVYPVLPFSQNPAWLVSMPDRPGRQYANLGIRALQDWLIDELVAFHDRTGIGGFAFDHTFLTYPGASRYAQWAGWRRVMETLRRRRPDIVIDGRQAYHLYGPWSWLAGSYPHPTASDEQPESFVPFPDLHFDRVSADRERYTAYRYRNHEFAPSEIVPGFITHQTSRSDDTGDMPSKMTTDRGRVLLPFRQRDWDYLGWRYSLLSSIAIAGWNNVLNMVPARDPAENRFFSGEDARWFRRWIDWTASHKEYLRRTRTVLGQPALGKVDGTSAIIDDRGYLFLFNPNARRLEAEIPLDASIGLTRGERFVVRELYPLEGRLVGKAGAGVWTRGDRVTISMGGASAVVLELQPDTGSAPLLFNAPGSARLDGDRLILTGVRGVVGSESTLLIRVPPNTRVEEVSVNDTPVRAVDAGADGLVTLRVRFAGAPLGALEAIVPFDPASTGGTLRGSFTIPQRIFDQLAARRKAWPIPWTAEDLETPWLAPERLLMFVQFAQPDANWNASLTIDGRRVTLKKAYTAVRAVPRTFVGFYADLSSLTADRPHRFELALPTVDPGRFQGVYFENVVTEYTTTLGSVQ